MAQTKQSGWRKIILTFAMDIFVFSRHFRCKVSTVCEGRRSFPIMFPVQRMEIPDFSEFSDYVSFSKDGNPWLFGIFRLCFLFKGWKSVTFAMDIFGFFQHFRWRCLEKLNSTAQTGLDPAISGIPAHYSTTEPHFYLKVSNKKSIYKHFWQFFWSCVIFRINEVKLKC